jgi:ABC-type transport system involved in cytochrome c biogenesis permease component
MALIVMACFALFYSPPLGWSYLYVLALVALVLFDYLAVGVILSAMTHTLRGGEVVLRILLFSVMIPVFLVATRATQPALEDGRLPGDVIKPVGALVGMGALYLAAGTWLFEKVVEE